MKFTKTSKIGPSMESLIAEFFQFSAKVIKNFVLSSWLGIGLYVEKYEMFSSNLLNFQCRLSAEVEIKLFYAYHL